jgi:rhomboid protease GluP
MAKQIPRKKQNKFRAKFPQKSKLKSKLNQQRLYGTNLLAIANLIVFGLAVQWGGSENIATLERLGALSPNDILTGEWWRAITANFIHYGWLHLASNLLGLCAIGGLVESSIGTIAFLIVYLLTGIGAMFGFSLLAIELGETNQLAMGASGSIMGLVGFLCALSLRQWYREKTWKSAGRFGAIVAIVIIQSVFDIITPQVSFIIHFFGLILGFLFGIVLLWV